VTGYPFALVLSALLVLLLLHLLRRRRLREKYVALWFGLAIAVVVLAAFPSLTFRLAALVGVATPVNLLVVLALAVLLGICVQLGSELSGLEDRARTLAEEVAILRHDVERLTGGRPHPVEVPQASLTPDQDEDPASALGER